MREDVPERSMVFARAMRKNPTEAEKKLWYALRDRRLQGTKFRRQQPVGPFIADFVCVAKQLVIEADGNHHAESDGDVRRDAFFRAQGYQVLRFSNHDILREPESVLATIAAACGLPW